MVKSEEKFLSVYGMVPCMLRLVNVAPCGQQGPEASLMCMTTSNLYRLIGAKSCYDGVLESYTRIIE